MFNDYVKNLVKTKGFAGIVTRAAINSTDISSEKKIVDDLTIIKDDMFRYGSDWSGSIVLDFYQNKLFLTWIPVPGLKDYLCNHKEENPNTKYCDYDIMKVNFRDYIGHSTPFMTTFKRVGEFFLGGKDDFDVHDLAYPITVDVDIEIEPETVNLDYENIELDKVFDYIRVLLDKLRIDKEDSTVDYDGKAVINLITELEESVEEGDLITRFDVDIDKVVFDAPENAIVLVNYNSSTLGKIQFFCKYENFLLLATTYKGKVDDLVAQADIEADMTSYEVDKEQ